MNNKNKTFNVCVQYKIQKDTFICLLHIMHSYNSLQYYILYFLNPIRIILFLLLLNIIFIIVILLYSYTIN